MKALSIQDLKKTYKGGVQALRGVSIDVEQGDFFGLLGPNGAGKTTLLGILTSLVTKTSGSVSVFGKDIDKELEAAKSFIGLVPQEFNFSIFEKVESIVVDQAGFYGVPRKLARKRAEKYLKQLELWDKRDVQARFLSGGMKRRLMVARALVHEPKLLLLDEPTAGVDIEIRRGMWQFIQDINQQGVTIILTTHYLEEAERLCKKIAIIDEGNIIEHSDMQTLLNKLHLETFVLNIEHPIDEVPELKDYTCRLVNKKALEVDVRNAQDLNHLFSQLSERKIYVTSMRNKTNRLEELFLSLVAGKELHDEQ